MARLVETQQLSNAEFLSAYARPGRIGLVGGSGLIDRGIRRAQRAIVPRGTSSEWSHAFLFGEHRVDGRMWVIESDLDLQKKQVRLGVQENRVERYYDESVFPNVAVLDCALDDTQSKSVLVAALDLLGNLTRYSIRELAGTLIAMQRPSMRERDNVLGRDGSIFCSALVRHCYESAGLQLVPGVAPKNTTPEDLVHSPLVDTAYMLRRDAR